MHGSRWSSTALKRVVPEPGSLLIIGSMLTGFSLLW